MGADAGGEAVGGGLGHRFGGARRDRGLEVDVDVDAVGAALRELGARPWQVDLVAPVIVAAVVAHPDDEG